MMPGRAKEAQLLARYSKGGLASRMRGIRQLIRQAFFVCDGLRFSRMRSRRVPVLKLGSRGPGVQEATRGRCVVFAKNPQASANRPRRVGHAGESTESKIVAKRRIVVTFHVSHYKSVHSHRDRGGRGRESQNCRHFWTRLGSSRLKSVNSHRDRGARGRETQTCRHFWTCLESSRVKSVNSHRDRGGRGRETQNCRHFWTRLGSSRLKSVNSHRDRGARGREAQNCRHFWTCLESSRVKSVTVTGIGVVVVAKRRPGVTFALASGFRVSKLATGIGGSWLRNADLASLLDLPRIFASQKCQQSQGSGVSWS